MVLAAFCADADRARAASMSFERSAVVIHTAGGARRFDVEMAVTPDQRARGLQYRDELARDAGMLFDYGEPQQASMWMKNTYVPLDMLFIAADGRIVNIAEDTVPLSLTPIRSDGPVRAVLEVRAGTAERLGIEPGNRVEHAIFEDVAE